MGVDTRRPPLPAPTDISSVANESIVDDLATDVSRRTDRTSYSIPEDGSPVTISTKKIKGAESLGSRNSQTSLLIEYFEAGKNSDKLHSRPSVRVRVTPSGRKSRTANDHIQITETSKSRKPTYTRRISLGSRPRDEKLPQGTEVSFSEESNLTGPPVEVEVLQNLSDLSRSDLSQGRFIPAPSDISSMPPDSMLEGEPVIQSPERRRSRSLERDEVEVTKDTLRAPERRRSRSLSKERITQKVMEKLKANEGAGKTREAKISEEELSESLKSPKHRHRRHRDDDYGSQTESSLLSASNIHRRSGDTHSIRSGTSAASSINNPKLLQTVEDAIRRLILPELNALKEEQKTQQNRNKFERIAKESTSSTGSRDDLKRRVSKTSSAPNIAGGKPKVVLNRHGDDPGTVLSGDSIRTRKGRRSSKGSISERSNDESIREEEEKSRRKSSKDRHLLRDAAAAGAAGVVGAGLTAAALRHHDSQASVDRAERRERHRKSRSRSASISESIADARSKAEIPPLPMQSELQGSEMTRESILSANTERPGSRSEIPIREVSQGSPRQVTSPTPRTPTRTPVALQRGLYSHHSNRSQGDISIPGSAKSDRSLGSKGRAAALAAANLAGATAASKLAQHEEAEGNVSARDYAETPTRELSPVQSAASYREDNVDTTLEPISAPQSPESVSSAGRQALHRRSNLSIDSLASTPSSKLARTRRRPQGANLDKGEAMSPGGLPESDVDEFFDREHEENEQYRRQLGEASEIGSPSADHRRMTTYTEDSMDGPYDDRVTSGKNVKDVGARPEYVHTPLAVESAVASLQDPSTLSFRSSDVSSALKHETFAQDQQFGQFRREFGQHSPSKQRWGVLRDQAESLSQKSQERNAIDSPHQSVARSEESIHMGATAFPLTQDPMPEIGYHQDDESEMTTNPSIIQGPIGGMNYGARSHWPAEPTPPMSTGKQEHDRSIGQGGKAAAIGAAGAAAIAAAAAARIQREQDLTPVQQGDRYQPSVEDEYDPGMGDNYGQNFYTSKDINLASPGGLWKDEGYISANQPGGITPEPYHQKLFDDDGLSADHDPFVSGKPKHTRHLSGNSHGMSSPLYDSATGRGIDRIQSKDVVALMDHLTVRDAQRNARDTEILVTLVRSAAEMRNSFEEMKKFIAEQDRLIMDNTDRRVGITEQKLLQGPRPQPLGSPRAPKQSAEDVSDIQTKRRNVFKRALKGLSLRSSNDLGKIEDMLMQLLNEVEGLKETQLHRPQTQTNTASLNSYENLRAQVDAGYEPEGHAGTSSTPNQSGHLSNPSSRRAEGMHSGYDGRRGSEHRISTVMEGDEDLEDHEAHILDNQFEGNERLLTPTQEVRRNNSLPLESPPQQGAHFGGSQSQENTPKKKHKSNSSSLFGIPKMSRWSKTTASTNPETIRNSGERKDRPYSEASRSGSNLNVNHYDNYELQEDDRIHSTTSLNDQAMGMGAEQHRAPSPLIPEEDYDYNDDPKYQAHRNSLNLQHPQPRPGPTHRHQTHLESQAHAYEPSSLSPDTDQWGSNPSLALNRHRLNDGRDLSPISSDGGYSAHSAAEQAINQASTNATRRPSGREDGPLVPPKIPLELTAQPRPMYSSPGAGMGSPALLTPLAPIQEVRYSLETDRYAITPSPRPSERSLNNAAMNSPQRKITGPRPMGSRSPSLKSQGYELNVSGTVRRKPVSNASESLRSYRDSFESETF